MMMGIWIVGLLYLSINVNAQTPLANSTLAERGATFAAEVGLREAYEFLFGNTWNEETNPNGFVNLGAAENAAMLDSVAELSQRYNFQVKRETFNLEFGPWGSPRLLKAMAKHVNRYLDIYDPFNETDITFATGVTAIFDLLGFSLFNAGDAILLTKPTYPGFAGDFALKAGVEPVFVSFNGTDAFAPSIIAHYEAAIKQHPTTKFRALILCNPHNPLGQSYPKETIIALMKFATRHKLHLIVDEVYALSTYSIPGQKDVGVPFKSAFSFDFQEYIDPNYIHLLYSTSKDFATFGLRLGALLTKNEELTRAVVNQVTFNWPGNAVQELGALILEDEEGKELFLAKSRETAARNSKRVRDVLDRAGVEYSKKANAGFFLWIDLGPWLPEVESSDQWEAEVLFTQRLLAEGIFLTGGQPQRADRAGFYRLCFSQPEGALREGLKRLLRVLGKEDVNIGW